MNAVKDPETFATSLDDLRSACSALLDDAQIVTVVLSRSELALLLGGLSAYERITTLTEPLLASVVVWHEARGLGWLEATEELHRAYSEFKRLYDAEMA